MEAGLAWGSGTVRLAALPKLAELHGADVAVNRALGDPSAKVRAWAAKTASRLPPTPADGRDRSYSEAEVDQLTGRASERPDSPTLFDD